MIKPLQAYMVREMKDRNITVAFDPSHLRGDGAIAVLEGMDFSRIDMGTVEATFRVYLIANGDYGMGEALSLLVPMFQSVADLASGGSFEMEQLSIGSSTVPAARFSWVIEYTP